MDNLNPQDHKPDSPETEEPSQGPSLVLMYSLIALAMLLATFIAGLIVLPFYLRR